MWVSLSERCEGLEINSVGEDLPQGSYLRAFQTPKVSKPERQTCLIIFVSLEDPDPGMNVALVHTMTTWYFPGCFQNSWGYQWRWFSRRERVLVMAATTRWSWRRWSSNHQEIAGFLAYVEFYHVPYCKYLKVIAWKICLQIWQFYSAC